jgi:adenosylcobinamide-phosphate synthase
MVRVRRRGPTHELPWHRRATAAGVASAIDRALGEQPLPGRLHPVALFGTAIATLERGVYDDRPAPGAFLAAAGVGLAATAGLAIGSPLVGGVGPGPGRRRS